MIWKHPIETTIKKNLVVWSSRVGEREICLQKEHLEGSWILGTRIHLVVPYIYIYVDSMYIYIYYIYICVVYTHLMDFEISRFSKKNTLNNNCFPAALFSSPKVLRFGPNDQNEKVRYLTVLAFVGGEYAGLCVPIFWVEEGNVDGVDGYRFRGQVGSNSTGFPGSARFFFGGGSPSRNGVQWQISGKFM